MDWIAEALLSAVFLGVYDICKKRSVIGNAVVPVLFLSVLCGAALWAPWALLPALPGAPRAPWEFLVVDRLSWLDHGRLFLKSVIVAGSWVFSYFALKHLPVSIAGGIRATSPLWTLLGAVLLLGERPDLLQSTGIAVTLVSFIALSFAGRSEGVFFHRNGWVFCMVVATLLGAVSGLYDKYLMGTIGYRASTMQAWFSIYLVVALSPLMLGWWRGWWPRGVFSWRWAIPLISITLLIADYSYFVALRDEEALISVVSSLRRGAVLITFAAGYFLFGERNYRRKAPCILGILAGIILIVSSR